MAQVLTAVRLMSDIAKIGITLFILGIAGFFYFADSFFEAQSGLWYFTTIASLLISVGGLVLLWKEWGRKSK